MWLATLGYYLGFFALWSVWWVWLEALQTRPGAAVVTLFFCAPGLAFAIEGFLGVKRKERALVTLYMRKHPSGPAYVAGLSALVGAGTLVLTAAWHWLIPQGVWLFVAIALTPLLGAGIAYGVVTELPKKNKPATAPDAKSAEPASEQVMDTSNEELP
ncbi:MAG: hypothetical protein L0Y72_15025 [Gemmataceae bacterium]|nr:hypothetical protein [Gemmataceae bacterium]MCI0740356.1 hypothetical protein [Gemmataceae bacterium]